MAIRNVVQVGDETLRKVSFPVQQFDEGLHQLLDDMKDTVRKEDGAGLAAPQVGVLRRAVVVDVEEGFLNLSIPGSSRRKGEQRGWEGCLSVRGKRGVVSRPMKVKIALSGPVRQSADLAGQGLFRARGLPRTRSSRRRALHR